MPQERCGRRLAVAAVLAVQEHSHVEDPDVIAHDDAERRGHRHSGLLDDVASQLGVVVEDGWLLNMANSSTGLPTTPSTYLRLRKYR
jgi:hypothetical protein